MRTSLMVLVASLLLLQLLATTAHGIRLDRQLHEALNNKKQLAGVSKAEQPSDAVAHPTSRHCTSDDRNCSGKAKKPVAPHAEHQVPARRNGGAQSRHDQAEVTTTSHACGKTWSRHALPRQKTRTTTYPDILDIAGMDYSPDTRKPPIHN